MSQISPLISCKSSPCLNPAEGLLILLMSSKNQLSYVRQNWNSEGPEHGQ